MQLLREQIRTQLENKMRDIYNQSSKIEELTGVIYDIQDFQNAECIQSEIDLLDEAAYDLLASIDELNATYTKYRNLVGPPEQRSLQLERLLDYQYPRIFISRWETSATGHRHTLVYQQFSRNLIAQRGHKMLALREQIRTQLENQMRDIYDQGSKIKELTGVIYDIQDFKNGECIQSKIDILEEASYNLLASIDELNATYTKYRNLVGPPEQHQLQPERLLYHQYSRNHITLRNMVKNATEFELQKWLDAKPCAHHNWGELNDYQGYINFRSCLDCNYVMTEDNEPDNENKSMKPIGEMSAQEFCNIFSTADIDEICNVPTPRMITEWQTLQDILAQLGEEC